MVISSPLQSAGRGKVEMAGAVHLTRQDLAGRNPMNRRRVMMAAAAAAAAWCAPLAVAVAGPAATSGSWRNAIEVPGLGALNKDGDAHVISVSCGSAGNCAAGGHYLDRSGHYQAFVASEKNGVWGKAIGGPGLAALNEGGGAALTSVAGGAAGGRRGDPG